MINARFWSLVNGSPVKITLNPDQALSWSRAWRHEEGWSSRQLRWVYSKDNSSVFLEETTDGRDCDGRLRRFYIYRCSNHLLKEGNKDCYSSYIVYPKWEKEDSFQRDYYAERMGY